MNVRTGELLVYHHLPKKQVKHKNSSVATHLVFCKHSASYDNFSILTRENKLFLLELKESLFRMRQTILELEDCTRTIVPI